MCSVLKAGFGIVALSHRPFWRAKSLGRIARAIAAYRACPGLSIKWSHVDRMTIRRNDELWRPNVRWANEPGFDDPDSECVDCQPPWPGGAGAVCPSSFTRSPGELCFRRRYAIMLAPAAAALSTSHNPAELKQFVKDAARSGVYVSLPVMVFLAINGEPLLQLWMGRGYADALLMLLLTFAFTADIVYQPLSNLLLGLNLHGRPGVFSAIGAGVAILLAYLALRGGYGLHAIAFAIAIPWSIVQGVYLPWFTCRKLEIPVLEFLTHVWTRPLLCSIPFGLALAAGPHRIPASLSQCPDRGCRSRRNCPRRLLLDLGPACKMETANYWPIY